MFKLRKHNVVFMLCCSFRGKQPPGLNSDLMMIPGRQPVGEPGSRRTTRADGLPAGLRLRHPAVLLDPAGLQQLGRRRPPHPRQVGGAVKSEGGKGGQVFILTVGYSEGPSRDVVLHLTSGRIHNKNVSTHLIGSISKGPKQEAACSVCGRNKVRLF